MPAPQAPAPRTPAGQHVARAGSGPGAPSRDRYDTVIVGGGHHGLVAATDASARAALLKATLAELDAHPEGPVTDCLALDDRGEPCIEAKTPLDLEGD